jgi:hypothetical protein
MPGTRRTPVKRQHTSAIAAALPLFQRALKARAKWKRSGSDADYTAAVEAQKDVDRAFFGPRRFWLTSIFDIDDIYSRTEPPDEARHHESWKHALELRQALEAADREQRRRERAARRAAKAPAPEPEPAV